MSADRSLAGAGLAVFSLRVRDSMRPLVEVGVARPEASLADAVAQFAGKGTSCVVVLDRAGSPQGVLTESDVARRIAFRADPLTPVGTVMSTPVTAVRRSDALARAIALMRAQGLRHLPVIDRDGRLAGLVSLSDALAAASARMLRLVERLGHEDTLDGMRVVKAAEIELAEELFAQGVPAADIQRLLTRINNDMYRRVGERTLSQMRAEGWGEPPVKAATIVMGSAGRGENYLHPDQDNGFVLDAYPDEEHPRVDAFFIELAERMCRDLNDIGIAFCNGYCMSVNPLWRKSLPQWLEQIARWTRSGSTVAVRLADIFLDFQGVWGDVALARELRREATRLVRDNRTFLRQMFQDNAEHGIALGVFGGFLTERDDGSYPGLVNLKYTGTLPLVSTVRLLSLREGIEATSTLDRIAALVETGVLDAGERDRLAHAFRVVTDVLLRRQIADYRAGRKPGYYVDPRRLERATRVELRAALRSIHALRKRTHLEFSGAVF